MHLQDPGIGAGGSKGAAQRRGRARVMTYTGPGKGVEEEWGSLSVDVAIS